MIAALQTVAPPLLNLIRTITAEPFFSGFRLVGGTCLSLHLGHRMSVDADFFTNDAFDKAAAIRLLSGRLPGFMVLKQSNHGFAAMYEQVKLDLYTWQTPFLMPAVEEAGTRLAALPDVAALKLEAIFNRKEEKDYRDVYALLQKYQLSELLQFFRERYPNQSPRLLTDHLLAAPYVERDQSLRLLTDETWEMVGQQLVESVRSFYEDETKKRVAINDDQLRQRLAEIQKRKE